MKNITIINTLESRDGERVVYYNRETQEYQCTVVYTTTKIESDSFRTKDIETVEAFIYDHSERFFKIQKVRTVLYRKGLSKELRDMMISLISCDDDLERILN